MADFGQKQMAAKARGRSSKYDRASKCMNEFLASSTLRMGLNVGIRNG